MHTNREAVRTIHNALAEAGASVSTYSDRMLVTVDGCLYEVKEVQRPPVDSTKRPVIRLKKTS